MLAAETSSFEGVFGTGRGAMPGNGLFAAQPGPAARDEAARLCRLAAAGELEEPFAALAESPGHVSSAPAARMVFDAVVDATVAFACTPSRLNGLRLSLDACGVRRMSADTVLDLAGQLHVWPGGAESSVENLNDLADDSERALCGKAVWFAERAVRGHWVDRAHRRCEDCAARTAELSLPDCEETMDYPALVGHAHTEAFEAATLQAASGLLDRLADGTFSLTLAAQTTAAYRVAGQRWAAKELHGSRRLYERLLGSEGYRQMTAEFARAGVDARVENVLGVDTLQKLISGERDSRFEFARSLQERVMSDCGLLERYAHGLMPAPSWWRHR